jgi:hypothetical protein
MISKRTTAIVLGLTMVCLIGCSSSKTVQVPPRMDLMRYGTIGMISFSSQDESGLNDQASRQFLAALQSAQPGLPVLELGDQNSLLAFLEARSLDPKTIRAIGEAYGVDVVIFGAFETKEVKPKFSMGSLMESVSASAEIEASLNAQIYDARSGATLWTKLTRGKETVAGLSLSKSGISGVGASDPDDVQEKLVRILVAEATEDFRPSYMRQ